jgi:hypothetical protein
VTRATMPRVVMTELLPGPGRVWLPGLGGQHYFSELRVQMPDPEPADRTNRVEDR